MRLPRMWAPRNILNYVRIKGNHCRWHLIMEILISIIEIHMSVHLCHNRGLGYVKEAGVYGGHEGSRAATLSHDAGQKFKFVGQDGGLKCFLYL